MPFQRAQKSLNFRAQPPPTCPCPLPASKAKRYVQGGVNKRSIITYLVLSETGSVLFKRLMDHFQVSHYIFRFAFSSIFSFYSLRTGEWDVGEMWGGGGQEHRKNNSWKPTWLFNEIHGFYYEFRANQNFWITADQTLSLYFLVGWSVSVDLVLGTKENRHHFFSAS